MLGVVLMGCVRSDIDRVDCVRSDIDKVCCEWY